MRQWRTFLVTRSLRRILPICGNSSSYIQRLRPRRRCRLPQRGLCSQDADVHRGQTSHPTGGTGGRGAPDTAWRVGSSCRAGLLVRMFPAVHLSSAVNVYSRVPPGAERAIRQPDSFLVTRCRQRLPLLSKNRRLSGDGSRLGAAHLERLKSRTCRW